MNRVWVYQADRFLNDQETVLIQAELDAFIQSWTAHGSLLAGSATLKDNLFIILQVDEQQAGVTGCSIDKSVHFLKTIGQKYAIDFFDRMKISFKTEDDQVKLVSKATFETLLKTGEVNQDTIVFNNLIQQAEELDTAWQIPLRESWHSKVF